MNINSLLEGANPYKSLQEDANRLANKWAASGLLEGISSEIEKNNMAMILENQAKQIVAEQSSTGTAALGSGQYSAEQWAGVALPLVRKVFAELSTKEFVSVQPMNLPSGLVFYLDFKYGTTKSPFNSGDSMYGVTDQKDVDASGGLYGVGRYGYSINNTSSVATSVATQSVSLAQLGYESGSTTTNFRLVAFSTASFPSLDLEAVRAFNLTSASVNMTTYPEYTFLSGSQIVFVVPSSSLAHTTSGTVATATVTYQKQPSDQTRGDFEDNPSGSIRIPEINVELKSLPIVAKTRKLKAQWTPEFAQDLNAYHSIDAEAELTSIMSEYISAEIDLEILDMLISDAATTEKWSAKNNTVWDATANQWVAQTDGYYNTQGQWFQTLGTKVQKVSNKIHQKTLRGGANFLVVSPSVATILESIPGYAADTNGDKMDFAMGVQKVGSLNSRFRVYKNPYMTENIVLMGFRGSQFLETGAVYAPYIPLLMTPLIYDPDTFTPRKGLMTRYAKEMIRPEFFGKIYVSNLSYV